MWMFVSTFEFTANYIFTIGKYSCFLDSMYLI